MKNNFITKIIGATLAFAMMIGGAVGINAAKQAKEVSADDKTYTLVTNASNLADGDTIIIGNGSDGQVKFMSSTQNSNNRGVTDEAAVSNGSVTMPSNAEELTLGAVSTNWTLYANNSATKGYLYASSSSSNQLKTRASDSDANSRWAITINGSNVASVVAQGSNSRKVMQYNSGSSIFACYGSASQAAVYIYKLNNSGGSQKQNVTLACNDLELDISDPAFTLSVTATSGGNAVNGLAYTYTSGDTDVVTVSNVGLVTPVAIGKTTITITSAENEDYNSASKEINVTVSDRTQTVSDLTFTAACGGTGTADDGAVWTVTSDASESTFDTNGRGIHYGTNNANVRYVQLSTSDIKGDIKQVVVNTTDAQSTATVSVTVGDVGFTCSGSTTVTSTSSDYAFSGNARGTIVVRVDRGSSMSKAIYVKSVVVTYTKINLSGISLSGNYQTTFNQGDTFNHNGMVVTANYDDSSSENVTALSTWTGYNMATTGQQTVTVTYKTKTAQYTINVIEAIMYSITGSITNGSLSSEDDVQENAALNITINANAKYTRPTSLTVTMGGDSYNGYSYNSTTGAFSIEHVTGDVTITGICPKAHGYWPEDPFTVAEARNIIDEQNTVNGAYVAGIVSGIVTPFNQEYGNISYNISADGATESAQLQAYRGKNLNNTNFTSDNDVQVGAAVIIFGNLKKYDSIYEFDAGNYLVSYQAPTAETFINSNISAATSVTSIRGNEISSVSGTDTASITFAQQNLSNDVQYSDPFTIGDCTITFVGGSNDGKYYNTGSGIRTYGGGSIEIASTTTGKITNITFTWSGSSYAPNSDDVADCGTYNHSTNIWSGTSSSVTLTRPSGSGHWRLQAVTVTYELISITDVDSVALRFGASIPVANWNAINSDEDLEITDYGVMVFKTREQYAQTAPTVQSLYSTNPAYVEVFRRGSGVAPTAEDGKYTFTARIDYTDDTEYSKYIIAQAFIVVNGTDYYFLGEEIRGSVRSLAGTANVDTNLSSGALTYLTTAGN